MDFTIRQLQVFVEAARDENFRTTADRLGISQPSISNHILALERKTGTRLFERDRGMAARLSPRGKELLEQAKILLREASKLQPDDEMSGIGQATLRVAAGTYLVDRWIRPQLPNFHLLADAANLEFLRVASVSEMISQLRKGHADVAFYTGQPATLRGISVERLRKVTVGLYAAPEVADAAADTGLDKAPFLMTPADSESELWQRQILGELNIFPANVVARSQYPDVQLELARKGAGIAILFDEEAREDIAAGRLVRLEYEFAPGYRCMLYQDRITNPRKLRAADFLKELLSNVR